VKNVRDLTGRFTERPHFEPEELDSMCDRALLEHSELISKKLAYPISTDFLQTLIEAHAASLDMFADLSGEGSDVEGVTDFILGARPRVRISKELSSDPQREVRLRTTLAHEFGHVHLHNALFQAKTEALDLFASRTADAGRWSDSVGKRGELARCKRETIVGAAATDWMEWQAGYVCGALLMPKRMLKQHVHAHLRQTNNLGSLLIHSPAGRAVTGEIATKFFVSPDAARVRLLVLGLAVEKELERSVFE
jgi:hypothetical protein